MVYVSVDRLVVDGIVDRGAQVPWWKVVRATERNRTHRGAIRRVLLALL